MPKYFDLLVQADVHPDGEGISNCAVLATLTKKRVADLVKMAEKAASMYKSYPALIHMVFLDPTIIFYDWPYDDMVHVQKVDLGEARVTKITEEELLKIPLVKADCEQVLVSPRGFVSWKSYDHYSGNSIMSARVRIKDLVAAVNGKGPLWP